jgi:tetratricopeptide (TPR) repeat protein
VTGSQKRASSTTAARPGWFDKLQRPEIVCLLLVAGVFIIYWPVAGYGFVNYDDGDYVSSNTHVQRGLTWAGIEWAFRTGHASNWHPLTWLSHMLDWQLFGNHPGWHHLVSALIHALNSAGLFLLLRRMTRSHARSATVAALFALHPLHVESVAWISERKDVLSTAFWLLTIWAYAEFAAQRHKAVSQLAQSPPAQKPRTPKVRAQAGQTRGAATDREILMPPIARIPLTAVQWYFVSLVAFALGLMSKPMLVTVPFLLMLLDYWPLAQINFSEPGWPRIGFRLALEKVPYFLLAIASSVVTFVVQRKGGAVSTEITLAARLANAVVSYVRYLSKTFVPINLSVMYPHPGSWPAGQIAACGASLLAVTLLAAWFFNRRPYLIVGWLWFLGTLVPAIGIVQVGIQSMADRYTYVPLIGIFIMLVWGLGDLAEDRADWEIPLKSLAGVSIVSSMVFAIGQVRFWKDSEALFSHTVAVTKDNYLAYNNLGLEQYNHGKTDLAIENYKASLKIKPTYEDALNNMGYSLAAQKKNLEAIEYYRKALRTRPSQAEIRNNLGNALSETGQIPEAIEQYKLVLEANPDHASAHNNLGIALAMQGKLDEALPHFQAALRLKPDFANAHSNLGNAYAAQRKFDDAIKEYNEALKLDPNESQAHNNLANALVEKGKLTEAIPHYEIAIRFNTNNPEAHLNLALVQIRLGKTNDAIAHLRESLRYYPDNAEAKKQLGLLGVPGFR